MKLKELRKQKGYTQQKLSLLSEVSQGKISEYEKGEVIPRADTAMRLAEALGCTLDELMGKNPEAKAG